MKPTIASGSAGSGRASGPSGRTNATGVSLTSTATTASWFPFRNRSVFWSRAGRRLLPLSVVFIAIVTLQKLSELSSIRLGNEAFASGYSLLTMVVFLLLLGARKKIVSHRLGSMPAWQRSHHYLGMASVGVYVLHAGWITNGWFETLLGFSFWAIAGSGIVSWYVNRSSPKMLRAAGQQILRQDIASKQKEIVHQAIELALAAAGKSDSAVLADHYRDQLQVYFSSQRNILYRWSPTGIKRRQLLDGLENLDRYLNEEGRKLRQQMSRLVQTKDDLDFQSAIQYRVRWWASVHTWLLGAFVVLTIAHVISAHQFSSHW